MKVSFDQDGWEDLCWWAVTDIKTFKRIKRLIEDIARDPRSGLGKPEPLKENFAGYWSRRITDEHRLVYTVRGDEVIVAQARYHYEK